MIFFENALDDLDPQNDCKNHRKWRHRWFQCSRFHPNRFFVVPFGINWIWDKDADHVNLSRCFLVTLTKTPWLVVSVSQWKMELKASENARKFERTGKKQHLFLPFFQPAVHNVCVYNLYINSINISIYIYLNTMYNAKRLCLYYIPLQENKSKLKITEINNNQIINLYLFMCFCWPFLSQKWSNKG